MKSLCRVLIFAAILPFALVGCDESNPDLPFAPLDCQRSEPADGFLNIKLTINGQNPTVPVTVYSGDIENLFIMEQDTVGIAGFSYVLPVDKTYAVTAEYLEGRDTVLVIDADRITTGRNEYRDTYCYHSNDGNIDVRLLSKPGNRYLNVRSVEDLVRARMHDRHNDTEPLSTTQPAPQKAADTGDIPTE